MKFAQNYSRVFGNDDAVIKAIERSECEPSLEQLIQNWLERTPGLEENGFNFWSKYKRAVDEWLESQRFEAMVSYLNLTNILTIKQKIQLLFY